MTSARLLAATLSVTLACAVVAARADDPALSHDAAREAVVRGEVKPLSEILSRLGPARKDRFVDVDLGKNGGRWIYAMTLLTGDGRYRVLKIDAATAKILKDEIK